MLYNIKQKEDAGFPALMKHSDFLTMADGGRDDGISMFILLTKAKQNHLGERDLRGVNADKD